MTRLTLIRKAFDLTQADVAHILRLSQKQISYMEHGKRRMYLDEAVVLARYLGLKVDDFVEYEM